MIVIIRLIIFYLFALFFGANALASPNHITVQSRISKPDNAGYLEAASVQFRLSVTDPVGTCILFQEDFANVNMADSKGLIAIKMGSGTKAYPAGAMTMKDLFTNFSSPVFTCQAGGTYTAAASDQRKLVMQFNDGSGWQTVPSLEINSVPFAIESLTSQNLGAYPAADYVRTAQFATCNPGEAVHFNGTTFTCIVGGGITNGGNTGVMTIGTNDASSLNLETNNTTRMTIDSTGNVGIGGAIVPAATLHTQTSGAKTSTTTSNYIENNATSATNAINKVGLDIQSTGVWNGAASNNIGLNVNVSGGTNNYAAIFQGGNVGVGTTAPISTLHVSGTARVTSNLVVGTNNLMSGAKAYFVRNTGATGDYSAWLDNLEFGANISSNLMFATGGTGRAVITGGDDGSANPYLSINVGNPGPEMMRVTSTGNVGVGTTAPAAKMEVAGEVKVGDTGLGCSAATKGSIRYNTVSNVLEFCNSTSWNLLQATACTDPTPDAFTFTNESNAVISTLTTSNIIQLNGINCAIPVSISGNGSPQFRICSDAACASILQDWTTSPSTISNNQYLQTRLTSDVAGGSSFQATIIAGSGATVWTVTTAGGDCVGTTPAVGTVCADGTIYVGLSPDGNVKMFTSRCDAGQTWDGSNCSGSRSLFSWNNGSGGAALIFNGITSTVTGQANSANIAGLADAGSPYTAAATCEALNLNGHVDWYLPGINELNLMYSNRLAIRNFDLTGSVYWSSTEETIASAIIVRFSDGINDGVFFGFGNKNLSRPFRCVRR